MVAVGGRRPLLAAVLVGALVVTAGCSSVLGGDGTRTPFGVPDRTAAGASPSTPTPTTTAAAGTATTTTPTTSTRPGSDPADVGADDQAFPELETDELAPGLTPEAVTSPDRLAGAHRATLENRSFRARYRRVEVGPGGRRTESVVVALSTDRRRFRVARTVVRPEDGPRGRTTTEFWSNGSETLRMITFGDTRTFGRLDADRSLPSIPDVGDPIRETLVRWAFAATVVREVRDVPSAVAPAQYRVVATGKRVRSIAPDGTPVRNLSVEAVVDSRGVVRRLLVTYDRPGEEGRVDVAATLAVTGIGTTDPDPPAWRADALEEFNGTEPIGGEDLLAPVGQTAGGPGR